MTENNQNGLVLGGRKLPFDTFAPEAGQVTGDSRDLSFRFVYRHIPFQVRLDETPSIARLGLTGDLGPMPYSAESALARLQLAAVLEAANAHLGPRFAIVEGRIVLKDGRDLITPVTALGVIEALALILLPLNPYLETIAVYLVLPAEKRTGASTVRPGWRRERPSRRRS